MSEGEFLQKPPEEFLKRPGRLKPTRFDDINYLLNKKISIGTPVNIFELEELDNYRDKVEMVGPTGTSEKILVILHYNWNGSTLIWRGQQIAQRLGGELLVVCFSNKQLTKNEQTFKHSIIKQIKKVGGKFEELPLNGDSVTGQIVQFATEQNVTWIVMGQAVLRFNS